MANIRIVFPFITPFQGHRTGADLMADIKGTTPKHAPRRPPALPIGQKSTRAIPRIPEKIIIFG
jgi:hypothetical protein